MWVSRLVGRPRLCIGSAFFFWRKKVFCISRDCSTLLQPLPDHSLPLHGNRGAASWNCMLNYALGETGLPQLFLHRRPADSGLTLSTCTLQPHPSPSLWTAGRPMWLCVLKQEFARVWQVPKRPLCTT